MLRRALGMLAAAGALGLGPPSVAEDWQRFRGPNGSGLSEASGLPETFGPEHNLDWATPVPFGRSSPVVGGSLVFLTAVVEEGLATLAIDRVSGEPRWRRVVPRARTAELHEATDSATPSPVTDGENVYVFFHEAGIVAYDAAGRERWSRDPGPFRNYYGVASSPVLAGDTLLLLCDQAHGSFLLALDKDTGAVKWRRERPGRRESYTTPVLLPDSRSPEHVLVAGSKAVDAYRLDSGEPVWTLEGVGAGPVASPVVAGGRLFISAPDHAEEPPPAYHELTAEHDADGDGRLSRPEVSEMWMARHFGWVDSDGDGFVSEDDWLALTSESDVEGWGVFAVDLPEEGGEPRLLWNHRRNVPYIPTPIVVGDVLFIVEGGIVTSLDAATGEVGRRGRLVGGSSSVHASPVAVGGRLYVPTLEGAVAVIDAAPEWSLLSVNELGAPIHASPAVTDGRLYVRTEKQLMAFSSRPED